MTTLTSHFRRIFSDRSLVAFSIPSAALGVASPLFIPRRRIAAKLILALNVSGHLTGPTVTVTLGCAAALSFSHRRVGNVAAMVGFPLLLAASIESFS